MRFVSKKPGGPIAGFVENLWFLNDAPTHRKERIVPSGTIELVINLQEDEMRIYDPLQPNCCRRFSGAIVSGAYSGPFVIDTREHAAVIGVHFRPGGAFPFLKAAATELADIHVDLRSLWGSFADELRERLCSAKTNAERFHLLEQALATQRQSRLKQHHAVEIALNEFTANNSDRRVSEVAREAGLSQRRFIQLFKREVGMSPKLFCRVQRFQKALARARNSESPNWSQFAFECGYCDQAHLINEFGAFSGLAPMEYRRQRRDRVMRNHVPLAG